MSNHLTNIPTNAIRNLLLGGIFLCAAFYLNTFSPSMNLASGATAEIREMCADTPGCEKVRIMRDQRGRMGMSLIIEFWVAPKISTQAKQKLRKSTMDRATGGRAVVIEFHELQGSTAKKGGQ